MHFLINTTKKPIFYYYYIPGDWLSIAYRKEFLNSAEKYN